LIVCKKERARVTRKVHVFIFVIVALYLLGFVNQQLLSGNNKGEKLCWEKIKREDG
jgi:hypothetical protein